MAHDHDHSCGGFDHHTGDYTPRQRADLDLVLAFNARFADAINQVMDTRPTEQLLDPDPMRYMWVDEGQGRIPQIIEHADEVLAEAVPLEGHQRLATHRIASSRRASRPAISTGADGSTLCCWIEWVPDEGDLLKVAVTVPGAQIAGAEVQTLLQDVADIYRPSALLAPDGSAWVFFGRGSTEQRNEVAVWGMRCVDGVWGEPQQLSQNDHPEFNQEVVAHADGRVEVCWQGRKRDRFGIYSRTWNPTDGWGASELISAGVEANVWDPAIATFADGSVAYAWSEYSEGTYRIVVRRRDRAGTLGSPRTLTSGDDYALHPSLAVTADQSLWCAFDLIVAAGHGGSGPTRLRPADEVGADPSVVAGARPPGDSVPSDLLPEITARIEVVRVDDDGLWRPAGELGEALDVVPAGLPKLVATGDGGLAVTYRIHRRLPLMTFYWEVTSQFLVGDTWARPITFSGTDGTLEEVSVTATADGLQLAAQCDDRLARALQWTEGFGGRECLYLTDHQGSIIWHALQDVGAIVTARVSAPKTTAAHPQPAATKARSHTIHSDDRVEARRWVGADRHRYVTEVNDREYTLYWGDLHRHSLVSRCTAGDEPNLEDFYRYAWDVCEYDFWAVTDHSENSSEYQWWSIQKIADLFHIPGRFIPFYGFEWTSPGTGHQNVIYGDVERGAPIFSAFAEGSTTPDGLWEGLEQHPEFPAITIPHHPGSAMVLNDWDYHHPNYSRLVEIFQACRGNYEGPGGFRQYSDATATGTFVIDGLKRGHKFGLIASSDHGFGASYVGAYATSLDRGAVFEALQERRTFAATTRDVVVDVRMGSTFLGEEVVTDGPREFTVHAHGYTDLARIDIVRGGDLVHSVLPDLQLPDGWSAVPIRLEWGGADQVTRWDGDLSITGGKVVQTPFWSPEIVGADEQRVAWRNSTRSFGEPYGAQRGGIECTLVGPPNATVRLNVGDRSATFTLEHLTALGEPEFLPGEVGTLAVQPGAGGLSGLGQTSIDFNWIDDWRKTAFYYVRVFQIDGEMAWSSPIWVTSPRDGD